MDSKGQPVNNGTTPWVLLDIPGNKSLLDMSPREVGNWLPNKDDTITVLGVRRTVVHRHFTIGDDGMTIVRLVLDGPVEGETSEQ